jgi:hypothetical protein
MNMAQESVLFPFLLEYLEPSRFILLSGAFGHIASDFLRTKSRLEWIKFLCRCAAIFWKQKEFGSMTHQCMPDIMCVKTKKKLKKKGYLLTVSSIRVCVSATVSVIVCVG